MLRIRDTLGGDPISFHYVEEGRDLLEVERFINSYSALGMDTEASHYNPYRPGWELRSFQVGNGKRAYIVPARYDVAIAAFICTPGVKWIAHNGTHDIRSIDAWVRFDTQVVCAGETYFPAHYADSRKQDDGGIGHALKDQAVRHVARDAGKWEVELKKAFKEIYIPIPGEVYKSGKRKGEPKVRKAHINEGWSLIDPKHPAYIAYSGADPILTYRLWKYYQPVVRANYELYQFDHAVQLATDKLQRRAMKIDVRYTHRLSEALQRQADKFKLVAAEFGCANINSGAQLAETLIGLGAKLSARTPTGQWKMDDKILRGLTAIYGDEYSPVKDFVHAVLGAKQVLKRRENYTEAFLRELDANGRVHPSINALAARTTRMSISDPALQQLPTKDREEEAE